MDNICFCRYFKTRFVHVSCCWTLQQMLNQFGTMLAELLQGVTWPRRWRTGPFQAISATRFLPVRKCLWKPTGSGLTCPTDSLFLIHFCDGGEPHFLLSEEPLNSPKLSVGVSGSSSWNWGPWAPRGLKWEEFSLTKSHMVRSLILSPWHKWLLFGCFFFPWNCCSGQSETRILC